MKKIALVIFSVILAALFAYLLWPLGSDDFHISWDEQAIAKKQEFLSTIQKAGAQDSLPNILFILVDDLGVNDMSYSGHGKVNTPHMDGIADAGIAFEEAYTASPICSPSRASILTGRYPHRYGYEFQIHDRYLKNRLEYYGFKYFISSDIWLPKKEDKVPKKEDIAKQGLPPSEISIADLLKARGYSTAIIGKWHTGASEDNLPSNFGFDYQYGFFDAHTLYAPEGTPGITDQKIKKDFTDQYNWKLGRKGTHGIFRDYVRIEEKEHLTDAITRECIDYMKAHSNGPFFLMAAYNAVHTPLQAPDRYVEMFKDEPDPIKRVYHAMIKQLDDDIGRLLDSLNELGMSENTLVIFMSDNGGATYTYVTDNAPFRGGKITDFEGGVRVPFFMSWPGKIKAGERYEAPVISMDAYATIAAAAGCPLPDDRTIDSQDLLEFIGSDTAMPHENLYWQRGNTRALRSGEWKVVWNGDFGDTLLYRIGSDPNERTDIFSQQKKKARKLIRIHDAWSDQLPEPLWPPVVYFREKVDGRWVYFDD